MRSAALADDEEGRIAALQSYAVLDTEAEETFDQLVALVASVIGVPIALVSLVDAERQWFKAKVGLEADETSRATSFCAHAILAPDIFEVHDALADERFADNPLVIGSPNIRFYAAAPLRTPEGHQIGTICAIDRQPRRLNDIQRSHLQLVARQIMLLLETRRAVHRTRSVFEEQERVIEDIHRKNDALENFAFLASHDLRAPLNRMQKMAELSLEELGSEQGAVRKKLDRIVANGAHLMGLVDGLLDVARNRSEEVAVEVVDVREVVDQVAESLRDEAAARDVAVRVDTPTGLAFRCRRPYVEQILQNLVSNSIRYSSGDRPNRFVSASVRPTETGIRIAVVDNGVGIPPECQDRFFDMFERFHPHLSEGHGLGAAIVKQAVDASGGSIVLRSSDAGTEIDVDLPTIQEVACA